MPNLDETELARLEELAGQYVNAIPNNIYDDCRDTLSRAVPALVAEVRRLREEQRWMADQLIFHCDEVPCIADGPEGRYFSQQSQNCTHDCIECWITAAREAVHADRE